MAELSNTKRIVPWGDTTELEMPVEEMRHKDVKVSTVMQETIAQKVQNQEFEKRGDIQVLCPEISILYDSIWSASEPSSSPPLLLLLAAEIRSQMRSLLFLGMHTFLLITRCLSDSSFFSKLSIHCLISTLP